MKNNSIVIDTTNGLIHFPHLTMQTKTASCETTIKGQPVILDDASTIPPMTKKTIRAFVEHLSKWNTTRTVTLMEKFTETACLLISHSMLTIIDKRIAVRETNTTETAYLIKKNTQIAQFSVVTPEQSRHIEPVDLAIVSMIPQGDPDLTAYLNELLRTNKSEQQNNTFWIPAPENLENLRITAQHRHQSSRKWLNSKIKKISIHKRAQNLETVFSNRHLIELTHFQQKQRCNQLKMSWSTIIIHLPDTGWTLGWTRNSRWN